MARLLTDGEIAMLVQERKPLPSNWRRLLALRTKGAHQEFEIPVTGGEGHAFRLVARRNSRNPLDFSVILMFVDGDETARLRRNNGAHASDHANKWERDNGIAAWLIERGSFHRHFATERYQAEGFIIDGYAEPADDYHDFPGAVDDMLRQCGFTEPDGSTPRLGLGDAL